MSIKNSLLAVSSLLTLAACGGVGPDYVRPQTAASAAAPFLSTGKVAANAAAPVTTTERANDAGGEWWRLYQDPVLDRLVGEALTANKDIAVATANLARARALLRENRAGRLPQTQIGASGQYGQASAIRTAPGADRENWTVDAGLSVSYEVDLFGRVGRSIQAARGDADAAAADLDAVRVTIAAETARAYADASSSAERLDVATRTLGLLDQTAQLTEKRFQAGRTSRLDVSRAMALREQQRATLAPLRADRDAALFRLATLTGRAPVANRNGPVEPQRRDAIADIGGQVGGRTAGQRRQPEQRCVAIRT